MQVNTFEKRNHYALRKFKKLGLVSTIIGASAISFLVTNTKMVKADSTSPDPQQEANNNTIKEEAKHDLQSTQKSGTYKQTLEKIHKSTTQVTHLKPTNKHKTVKPTKTIKHVKSKISHPESQKQIKHDLAKTISKSETIKKDIKSNLPIKAKTTLNLKSQTYQLPKKNVTNLSLMTSLFSLSNLFGSNQYMPEPNDAKDLNQNEYIYNIKSDPVNNTISFIWHIKDLVPLAMGDESNQLRIFSQYNQVAGWMGYLSSGTVYDSHGSYIGYAKNYSNGEIITLDPDVINNISISQQDLDLPITLAYEPHVVFYETTDSSGNTYNTPPVDGTILFDIGGHSNSIQTNAQFSYQAQPLQKYENGTIVDCAYIPTKQTDQKMWYIIGSRKWNYQHTKAHDSLYYQTSGTDGINKYIYKISPYELANKQHFSFTVSTDHQVGPEIVNSIINLMKSQISNQIITSPSGSSQKGKDPIVTLNNITYYDNIDHGNSNLPLDEIHITDAHLNDAHNKLEFDLQIPNIRKYYLKTTYLQNLTNALNSERINDSYRVTNPDLQGIIVSYDLSLSNVNTDGILNNHPNYDTDIHASHDIPSEGQKRDTTHDDYLYGDDPHFVPYSAYNDVNPIIQKRLNKLTYQINGSNEQVIPVFYVDSDKAKFDAKSSNSDGYGRLVFIDTETNKIVYAVGFNGKVETQPGTIDAKAAQKWLDDHNFILDDGQSIPTSEPITSRHMKDIPLYVHSRLKKTPISLVRQYRIFDNGQLKTTINVHYTGLQLENIATHAISYSNWKLDTTSNNSSSYNISHSNDSNIHTKFVIKNANGQIIRQGQDNDVNNINDGIFDVRINNNVYNISSHPYQNDQAPHHNDVPENQDLYITHSVDTEKRYITIHYLDQANNNHQLGTQLVNVPYVPQYNDYEVDGFINVANYVNNYFGHDYLVTETEQSIKNQVGPEIHGTLNNTVNGHLISFGWRDSRHELGHTNTDIYIHVGKKANGTVKFLDTENNNSLVKQEAMNGMVGDVINLSHLTIPNNYILAPNQVMPNNYQLKDNSDNQVIVLLAHKHQQLTPQNDPQETNAQIAISATFIGTDGKKAHNENFVATSIPYMYLDYTRTGDKDLITNHVIWSNWQINQNTHHEFSVTSPKMTTLHSDTLTYVTIYKDVLLHLTYNNTTHKVQLVATNLPNPNKYKVIYDTDIIGAKFDDNQQVHIFMDQASYGLKTLPTLELDLMPNELSFEKQYNYKQQYDISIHADPADLTRTIKYVDEESNQILATKQVIGPGYHNYHVINPLIEGYTVDVDKFDQQYSDPKSYVYMYSDGSQLDVEMEPAIEDNTDIFVPMKKVHIKVPHNKPVQPDTPVSSYTIYTGHAVFPQGLTYSDLNKEITRTIIITDDNYPNRTPQVIKQVAHWYRDADYTPADGNITYTDWQSYDETWQEFRLDKSRKPTVTGTNLTSNGNIPAITTSLNTDDVTVYVHYPYINMEVPVIWEDSEMSNRQIKSLNYKISDLDPYESLLDWVGQLSNSTLKNFDYWNTVNGYDNTLKNISFKVLDGDNNVIIPEVTNPRDIAGKTIGSLFTNGTNIHDYKIIISKKHGEKYYNDQEAHISTPLNKTKQTYRTIRVHMPDGTIKTYQTGVIWGLIDSKHDSVTGYNKDLNKKEHYKIIKNKHNNIANPAYDAITPDYIYQLFGQYDGYSLSFDGPTEYEALTPDSDNETVDVYYQGQSAQTKIAIVSIDSSGNVKVHNYNYLAGHMGKTYRINYPSLPAGYKTVSPTALAKSYLYDQGYQALDPSNLPEFYRFTAKHPLKLAIVVIPSKDFTATLQPKNNYQHPLTSATKDKLPQYTQLMNRLSRL